MVFSLKEAIKTTINGHILAVCKVKSPFQVIFGGFIREVATNSPAAWFSEAFHQRVITAGKIVL
jgi:hypothetical protein